jgi:hypothetical protein
MAAMADVWKTLLWRQFGAAIDMLDNALRECPDELWTGILWGDNSAAATNARLKRTHSGPER